MRLCMERGLLCKSCCVRVRNDVQVSGFVGENECDESGKKNIVLVQKAGVEGQGEDGMSW